MPEKRMKPNLSNLNPHSHTKELYTRHPVYKRIKRLELIQNEIIRLENALRDLPELKKVVKIINSDSTNSEKTIFFGQMTFEKNKEISEIEKNFTTEQKQKLVDAGIEAIAEVLGLPKEFVQELHTKQNWKPINNMPDLIEIDKPNPKHYKTLASLPEKQRQKLEALINKRIIHDSIIQGNALRLFSQGIGLFAKKINELSPDLAGKYRHFASLGQLSNFFMELSQMPPSRPSISKVKLNIENQKFSIETSGVNFAVLFQEIAKGTYDALMHEGMPTKEELGGHEDIFHNLTTNDIRELEHFKTSPEISKRFHSFLADTLLQEKNRNLLKAVLRKRQGYSGEISDSLLLTWAYKAFSKFSPRYTSIFMTRIINQKMDNKLTNIFIRKIIQKL